MVAHKKMHHIPCISVFGTYAKYMLCRVFRYIPCHFYFNKVSHLNGQFTGFFPTRL
jgi:hypothetical protein